MHKIPYKCRFKAGIQLIRYRIKLKNLALYTHISMYHSDFNWQGQGFMVNVHYKQCAWSFHHVLRSILGFFMSHESNSFLFHLVGLSPSWAVSCRPHMLSRASIMWPLHTHGTLALPSWSQYHWCMRCKVGLKISSTLVNFQGWHIAPISDFLL